MPPIRVSPKQAEEFALWERGRDPVVFAEEILGVRLNPAQRRWFSLIRPQENGWEWHHRFVAHVAANQIGKTLGLAIVILWACWYKIGVRTEDANKWRDSPYSWFHVAPTQPQADLPLKDISLLMAGSHPAQVGRFRLPKGLITEQKVEHYYDGLVFSTGAVVQFRTTDDKAKALQGRRAAGISFDECAFENDLKSVLNETLMMRLISTGGPILAVSTPNGINDWFEVVQAIVDAALPREKATPDSPHVGGSCKVGAPVPIWTTNDGQALLWSTVEDNIGFGIGPEEAARMERDLDPATKEQQLRGAFLEPSEAYFVPSSYVLDTFIDGMADDEPPQEGHAYVIGWDPSSASDPSVGVVFDVTKKPWRGVQFIYHQRPIGDTKLLMEIYATHALYNSNGAKAITAFDETSMGGAMLRQALAGLSPKRGVNFAGMGKKRELLTNLRAAVNGKALVMPKKWTQMQRELLNYRLPDDKIKQDCVMALGIVAQVAASGALVMHSIPFRPSAMIGRRPR